MDIPAEIRDGLNKLVAHMDANEPDGVWLRNAARVEHLMREHDRSTCLTCQNIPEWFKARFDEGALKRYRDLEDLDARIAEALEVLQASAELNRQTLADVRGHLEG